MKPLYFYANNVYQFSYALPVYNKTGGVFVVPNRKRLIEFKRYFRNLACFQENTFLNTPEIIVRSRRELDSLHGIIFFLSNSIIPEHDYQHAVTIFHEHGTSDKRYGGRAHEKARQKLDRYDYIFLSGPKNLKRLEEVNLHFASKKLVEIGGLRFDDYLQGRFSKEDEMGRFNMKEPYRKNILYAPTWRFGDGTLKKYGLPFIREITQKHNLIIRPHFHDRKFSYRLQFYAKLQGMKHVYFSNASNIIKHDTFRDFVLADLMISDVSSVIYEFLITAKPMIIVDNGFENRHQMPKNMDIMQNVDIYDESRNILEMVNANLENHQYESVYRKMVEDSFYLKGSAVDRAVSFLTELRHEGIS